MSKRNKSSVNVEEDEESSFMGPFSKGSRSDQHWDDGNATEIIEE